MTNEERLLINVCRVIIVGEGDFKRGQDIYGGIRAWSSYALETVLFIFIADNVNLKGSLNV